MLLPTFVHSKRNSEGTSVVRRATGRNLDQLVPLFEAYRQFYHQRSSPQQAKKFLRERITRKDSVIFVALEGQLGACGFVQLYPTFSSVSMKKLWILNDLFVLPGARHHGVAKALVERSVQLARKTRAKGLILETGADNQAAKSLYEKLGWKRDVEFDRYFINI